MAITSLQAMDGWLLLRMRRELLDAEKWFFFSIFFMEIRPRMYFAQN